MCVYVVPCHEGKTAVITPVKQLLLNKATFKQTDIHDPTMRSNQYVMYDVGRQQQQDYTVLRYLQYIKQQ